jgi:hypothetical protein
MNTHLQLFGVTVTTEWVASVDALIWATSKQEAKETARIQVELDVSDAEESCYVSGGHVVPLDVAQNLTPRQVAEMWLLDSRGNDVELKEFLEEISPDQLEAMRLRQIEANNGQLVLLEMAPA